MCVSRIGRCLPFEHLRRRKGPSFSLPDPPSLSVSPETWCVRAAGDRMFSSWCPMSLRSPMLSRSPIASGPPLTGIDRCPIDCSSVIVVPLVDQRRSVSLDFRLLDATCFSLRRSITFRSPETWCVGPILVPTMTPQPAPSSRRRHRRHVVVTVVAVGVLDSRHDFTGNPVCESDSITAEPTRAGSNSSPRTCRFHRKRGVCALDTAADRSGSERDRTAADVMAGVSSGAS